MLFGRKPAQGSCGEMSNVVRLKECEIYGGEPTKSGSASSLEIQTFWRRISSNRTVQLVGGILLPPLTFRNQPCLVFRILVEEPTLPRLHNQKEGYSESQYAKRAL